MKQIETLNLIRARCVELLEQAKLRTPGAWHVANGTAYMVLLAPGGTLDRANTICTTNNPSDTAYIANASVAFEATLESTVSAIDSTEQLIQSMSSWCENNAADWSIKKLREQQARIITAWKHLLP